MKTSVRIVAIVGLSLTAMGGASGQVSYSFTDLGAVSNYSFYPSISATGQIAGGLSDSGIIWKNGAPTVLDSLNGNTPANSYAAGINASGQAVGYSLDSDGAIRATVWSWNGSGYVLTNLGSPGPADKPSFAQGINAGADVVGHYENGFGRSAIIWKWNGTGYTPTTLSGLGGSVAWANGINVSGRVAGEASLPGDSNIHAATWAWDGSSYVSTDLGTLGGSYSWGKSINDAGTVAGFAYTTGNAQTHAARWAWNGSNYVSTDLGTLGGANSEGYGINASGQVVGFARNTFSNQRAFLYEGGVMLDLNDYVDGAVYSGAYWTVNGSSDWQLKTAYAINDQGQIVGFASQGIFSPVMHAFLLTPIPEPSTYAALAGLGALGLALIRRRRTAA